MAEIEILRSTPPTLGTCTAPDCRQRIEWVETLRGRRMPVDHPLVVVREHVRDDGRTLTVIDAGASHFATCVAAPSFRRKG